MIEYRKIEKSEKQELSRLVAIVLDNLERKDFFVPFGEEEIDAMFDESNAVTYGAYDGEKMVGTAQLYLGDEFVDEIKEALGVENTLAAEFGGVLVLPEYRGNGIMKHFGKILVNEAKARKYEYVVAVAHPENIASNKGIVATGATRTKTANLGEHYRNLYLLSLGE